MQEAYQAKSSLVSAFDGLLHMSCKRSLKDQARHRLFMVVHLTAGLLALASLPLVLLLTGVGLAAGHGFEQSTLGPELSFLPFWMLAPLVSVAYLSRTGNLSNAFLLTAIMTAAFLVWIASLTGGMHSPHLIWLGIIPLEVALAGNSRIIKQALVICLLAIAMVSLADWAGWIQSGAATSSYSALIATMSVCAAILYAGILAVRVERLHRGRMSELEAKELYYRSIANSVSDMITRHDLSGDVTFASPSAKALFALDPEQVLGNQLFRLVHIPDRPTYLRALSACMHESAQGCEPVSVELRVFAGGPEEDCQAEAGQTGSLCWVEMKCAPEIDEQGVVTGAIAVTRDISKRKAQQLALETARQEAECANQSKIRFLANVTHELRTPLNTIIGFSEILCHPELTDGNEEKAREYAELIHNGGHHLLQLVNDLLDMSRIESGNFEVCPQHIDLGDLMESCCKMMQAEADQRGIDLVCQPKDVGIDQNIDPRACRQILLNLISNALKFSDRNDQVTVSLDWAQDSKGIRIPDRVALIVRDTGIGIDQKDIPNLGRPFVQAESSLQRRFEGAGIGLSIVRGLAELQYGSMQIDSELGKGTNVVIQLPIDMTRVGNGLATKEPNSPATLESATGALNEHPKTRSKVA